MSGGDEAEPVQVVFAQPGAKMDPLEILPQAVAKLGDTKDKAATKVPQVASFLAEVVWDTL